MFNDPRAVDTDAMSEDALLDRAIALAYQESDEPSDGLILVWFYRLIAARADLGKNTVRPYIRHDS